MARVIKRGQVWLVNLQPGFGREIHKKRPALIISANSINNYTPYVVIVPASSQIPKMIGTEMVSVGKKEGLDKQSVLLALFIRNIDQERLIKKIGSVSKAKLQEAEEAIRLVLDLQKE